MNALTRDPLLTIAKGLLLFLMGAMIVAAISCLIAVPALMIYRNEVISGIARDLPHIDPQQFVLAIVAVLLLCAGLCAVLWKVFQLLKRIIDTVGRGDPFVPVNARRLTQMAWLVLAVQLVSIPIGAIGAWIGAHADDRTVNLDIDAGISGNGLLLMLVLFILARVFRHGAAMREELEATV